MIAYILIALLAAAEPGLKGSHQMQDEENRGRRGDKGPVQEILPLDKSKTPRVSKTIFGYDPYWTSDTYLHYDLITHLACFSVGVNADGSLDNSHNFPSLWSSTINLAHRNGVKAVLCATCFSSTTITSVLSSAANRTNAARNLVAMVRQASCDGVNIDFEGLPLAQKQNMVNFIRELSDSFHTWNPQSHVSLATPAVDWSGAWDYDSLAIHSDGLFIMAYDYFWSGSSTTGPVSPLDGYNYDVLWTIHDYIYYSGGRREKLICGFPYYGFDWPCSGTEPGSSTTGSGTAVTFVNAQPNAQSYGRRWYSPSSTPWYYYYSGGYHQGWYDDEESLLYKYQTVWDSGLAGTGMWALSYDGDRHELWDALRWAFNKPNDSLQNGGMEQVFLDTAAVPSADSIRPDGWLEGQYALAVTAADYVHSGSRSLKHYPKGWGKGPPYTSILFQDVAVQPGIPYSLSLWARKNDGGGNIMQAGVVWLDAKHREIREDTTASLPADSAGYRLLTTGDVLSPTGAVTARIKLKILATSATPYWDRWDDVSFGPVTGVAVGPERIRGTQTLSLFQNSPNPFSRVTTIRYQTTNDGPVSLKIYNLAGQCVKNLTPPCPPLEGRWSGVGSVTWDGRDESGARVAAGIYVCRLVAGGEERSGRMLLVK
jgi:spore germination protein YaaH